MNEEGILTEKIVNQILSIRNEGKFNMFDTLDIKCEAYKKGYYELVQFMEDYIIQYVNFILTGQK